MGSPWTLEEPELYNTLHSVTEEIQGNDSHAELMFVTNQHEPGAHFENVE